MGVIDTNNIKQKQSNNKFQGHWVEVRRIKFVILITDANFICVSLPTLLLRLMSKLGQGPLQVKVVVRAVVLISNGFWTICLHVWHYVLQHL